VNSIKQTLLGIAGDTVLLLTVAAVFLCVALLWYATGFAVRHHLERYKESFTTTASANMSDMFLFIDPNRLYLYNLGAIVIFPGLVWLLTRDLTAAGVMLVMVLVLPSLLYRRMRTKRLQRFLAQLPDALSMVAGSMRAGASLNVALESMVAEQAAPIAQEFELLLREQRLGVDFDVSLQNMESRVPLQDVSLLITALRINREVGGNLAETVESLGETLRRKAMMDGKITSLTAQGKLQGVVMAGLPVLLALLLYFMEPESMAKLWTTSVGWGVLTVVGVMEILGYTMIRKITSIDV